MDRRVLVAQVDVDRLGPDRLEGAYAWRRFLDLGVPLALGSDRFDASVRAEIDYLSALRLMPPPRSLTRWPSM